MPPKTKKKKTDIRMLPEAPVIPQETRGAFWGNLKSFFTNQKNFSRIVFFLALISIAAATYFFIRFNQLKNNPSVLAQSETETLVARVSKLVALPQNEVPTVATVSEPELLKNQPFFANAKKGDKVLIYTKSQKAILYDPAENKIIEIASINLGNNGK